MLRVAEAISIDVGRGIARMDPDVAEKLKISAGDAIEIFGKRRTFALCWTAHPRDAGKGLIRIDGYIRDNAGVSIDDKVRVKKISAKYSQTVTLAPTEPLRIVGGEEYVKNILTGRIVAKGDSVPVRIMGRVVNLVVTAYQPMADAVIVNEDTVVKISEKVYAAQARTVPRITYEDIGGLRDAIQKVREMVELPLRHPELFESIQ